MGIEKLSFLPRPLGVKKAVGQPAVSKVSSEWTWNDHSGQIKCRISSLRMRYMVNPGLYAVGEHSGESDVFVTANYKLSFDIVRRELKGLNAWMSLSFSSADAANDVFFSSNAFSRCAISFRAFKNLSLMI